MVPSCARSRRRAQSTAYSSGSSVSIFSRRLAGAAGQALLQILETRMDNVVYRLGFADSRKQARQLVRHGHFALNGRRTDIPSAAVRAGDAIGVYQTSRDSEYFQMVRDTMTRKN